MMHLTDDWKSWCNPVERVEVLTLSSSMTYKAMILLFLHLSDTQVSRL